MSAEQELRELEAQLQRPGGGVPPKERLRTFLKLVGRLLRPGIAPCGRGSMPGPRSCLPRARRRAAGAAADARRAAARFRRWLDDYPSVAAAIESHGDLETLLDSNGGLVKISNFLPDHAAAGVLAALRALPEAAWNDTSAARDYAHNNISHAFESVKEQGGGEDLAKVGQGRVNHLPALT